MTRELRPEETSRAATGHRSAWDPAFALIELLGVMAVLIVIVAVTATLLSDSARVRAHASRAAEADAVARGAMQVLGRDLAHAVADEQLTFAVRDDRLGYDTYGVTNSEVCLLAWMDDPAATNRALQEIFYWVEPATNAAGAPAGYQLVRGRRRIDGSLPSASPANPYGNTHWYEEPRPDGEDAAVLLENVAAFVLGMPDVDGDLVREYESAAQSNRLPSFVDVYIEVLDRGTVARVEQLVSEGEAVEALVDGSAVRFAIRVGPHNRRGEERP